MVQLSFSSLFACLALLLASVVNAKYPNIAVAMGKIPKTITFNRILQAASPKLTWVHSTNWTGTIFVPTDTAWSDLMLGLNMNIAAILKKPALCAAIANYHTLSAVSIRRLSFPNSTLPSLTVPTYLPGAAVSLSTSGSAGRIVYTVSGALNSAALSTVFVDLGTAKGTVHVITKALIPPGIVGVSPPPALPQSPTIYAWLANQTDYSSIFKVVSSTVDALGLLSTQTSDLSVTFLIPSNAAFAALAASKNVTVPEILSAVSSSLVTAEKTISNHILKRPFLLSSVKDLTNLATWASNTIVLRNVQGVVTLTTPVSKAKIIKGPLYFGASPVYIIDSVLNF